jgi:hypothetical protein
MIYISNDEIKKNQFKKTCQNKKNSNKKIEDQIWQRKKTSKPCALLNLV